MYEMVAYLLYKTVRKIKKKGKKKDHAFQKLCSI